MIWAYGLRETPRLWYRHAREVLLAAGLEELQTAKACFVLRDPRTRENPGMRVLHVGGACAFQAMARGDMKLCITYIVMLH